ncbi:MAG: hypothetical protein ACM34J_01805, partial [Ignavibacteria bacterium]
LRAKEKAQQLAGQEHERFIKEKIEREKENTFTRRIYHAYHFNGETWKNYLGEGLEEISGNYYSTAIKDNTIVAVGNSADGKAIAVIGGR